MLVLSPTGKVNEPFAVNTFRNSPELVGTTIFEALGEPLIVVEAERVRLLLPRVSKPAVKYRVPFTCAAVFNETPLVELIVRLFNTVEVLGTSEPVVIEEVC